MICLLLIMTIIFISSTESGEQKIKHLDTLLKEEDMAAKTKIWLLMVESGKVDEEELRRITPKSIFIAPLLENRTGKCKEGYRHDHLGQCVKVIKIDPKVQLQILLQRLNQLYSEKKEEKEEEQEEIKEETEVSNGPLHFSLPISNVNGKIEKENNEKQSEPSQENFSPKENFGAQKNETTAEFIPIPISMMYRNQTDQTKEFESSGAEPLNVTEPIENLEFEGSGDWQVSSGEGFREETSTTSIPVSAFSLDTDYSDVDEIELTTLPESQFTDKPYSEELPITEPDAFEEVSSSESYQNTTDSPGVNDSSRVLPKENTQVQKEIFVKNNSNPDRIIFKNDDGDRKESLKISIRPSPENSRIRFPDDIPQPSIPSHHSLPDLNSKTNKYQTHSSAIPREQFWWLPKNWQIDENQQKSPLVNVWSRLPLIHDVSYPRENSDGIRKSGYLEQFHTHIHNPQHNNEGLSDSLNRQQPLPRNFKTFRSTRFQDIIPNQRQHFRLQR